MWNLHGKMSCTCHQFKIDKWRIEMINFTINGIEASVEEGTTILDAAKKYNIHIPTLCHLKLHELNVENATASCRVCVVEEEGKNKMLHWC